MEQYSKPQIEIIVFENTEIIITSPGDIEGPELWSNQTNASKGLAFARPFLCNGVEGYSIIYYL